MVGARPPLVVIAGVTGVGKTAAAVALAARLPIEVVSADSRQVYRGLDTATGKPTAAERAAVAHHLIDIVEPGDRYNAARFRRDALGAMADIRGRGRLPVVVGGTGLYIRALLRGLDPAPPADPIFRAELAAELAARGAPALHRRLADTAPEVAGRLHPHDAVRIVRALERARAGGSEDRAWAHAPADPRLLYVGLSLARARLRARLRARGEAMVRAGLADEVARLLAAGHSPSLPVLQGIGYRDFARVRRGEIDEAEALRRMVRDTVRYAKRQLTWFRREPELQWIDVDEAGGPAGVAAWLEERLVTMERTA